MCHTAAAAVTVEVRGGGWTGAAAGRSNAPASSRTWPEHHMVAVFKQITFFSFSIRVKLAYGTDLFRVRLTGTAKIGLKLSQVPLTVNNLF